MFPRLWCHTYQKYSSLKDANIWTKYIQISSQAVLLYMFSLISQFPKCYWPNNHVNGKCFFFLFRAPIRTKINKPCICHLHIDLRMHYRHQGDIWEQYWHQNRRHDVSFIYYYVGRECKCHTHLLDIWGSQLGNGRVSRSCEFEYVTWIYQINFSIPWYTMARYNIFALNFVI